MSLAFESIAPGNRFQFDPDSVHDGNHRSRLEYERRQHRAELMNGQRIVAIQHHIPAPVTPSDNEQLDLEISRRLPLRENFQNPLLAFSYSIGDPCGRSDQVSMYFIGRGWKKMALPSRADIGEPSRP